MTQEKGSAPEKIGAAPSTESSPIADLVRRLRDDVRQLRAGEWLPAFGAVADAVAESLDEAADALERLEGERDGLLVALDEANRDYVETTEALWARLKTRDDRAEKARERVERLEKAARLHAQLDEDMDPCDGNPCPLRTAISRLSALLSEKGLTK